MAVSAVEATEKRKKRGEEDPNLSRDIFDDRDPGTFAAHELLFGKDPQIDIVEEGLLTPEQQAVLQALLQAGP